MDYLEAFKLHKFLLTAVDKSHQLVVDKSPPQATGCSRSESTQWRDTFQVRSISVVLT